MVKHEQADQDHGDRQDRLHDAADDLVDAATDVAGDQPEQRSDDTLSSAASGAVISTSRAPTITRESTSRPSVSVPNG